MKIGIVNNNFIVYNSVNRKCGYCNLASQINFKSAMPKYSEKKNVEKTMNTLVDTPLINGG